MKFEFNIDLILSLIIMILLIVLFIRELKNNKEVDMFVNGVIVGVAGGSGIFALSQDKFQFTYVSSVIYLITIFIALAYLAYVIVKFKKQKKASSKEDEK